MLTKVIETLSSTQDLTQEKGIFLSAYNSQNELVASNGSIQSDKQLSKSIEILYESYMQQHKKQITQIICDIVWDIQEANITTLMGTDLKQHGICLSNTQDNTSGCLLPNTPWVSSVTQAIALIKQKNNIKEYDQAYTFTTQRISIK